MLFNGDKPIHSHIPAPNSMVKASKRIGFDLKILKTIEKLNLLTFYCCNYMCFIGL